MFIPTGRYRQSENLYGRNLWYNDLGVPVNPSWFSWSRSVISIYHNKFVELGNLTPTRIRHTTAHEVGHSLGLDHTTSSTYASTSLMTSGDNPSLNRDMTVPSSYDIGQLRSLYGGPAFMAPSLNTDTSASNEVNVETQYYYTLNNLNIKKVLEGDSLNIGENLEVIESNSIVHFSGREIKLKNDGYKETQKGEDYILFLKKNLQGKYTIINRSNGSFNVNDIYSTINEPKTSIMRSSNGRDGLLLEIAQKYSADL